MKFLSNLRSKIEGWLINDTLNNTNFTNINKDGDDFIKKFGVNQLCLLEMFDEQTKCFYGSDVAGFGFVLTSTSPNQQYDELQYQLLIEIAHITPRGFGVQITSVNGQLIVSVSCNTAFTNQEAVNAMIAVQLSLFEHLQKGFAVCYLDAEELINISSQILYPNRLINAAKTQRLTYKDAYFVRDQLAPERAKIEVNKDALLYEIDGKKFKTAGLSVRQYYNAQNIQPTLEQYQQIINDKVIDFANAVVTMGIYNPAESKKPKGMSEHEHHYKQKLQVYHVLLAVTPDDAPIDNTENVTAAMRLLEYHMEPVNNRQLGTLFFSLPMGLGEAMATDIYDLRLCKSVDTLHIHDLFPVIFNLVGHDETKIQTV